MTDPHFSAVMEFAHDSAHGLVEPDKDLFERTLHFGRRLNDYLTAVAADEKILVVSHGRFMRAMLSDGVMEGKKAGAGFANTFYVDNTQCIPTYFIGAKPTHNKQSTLD
jgi:broad specificity phosphatase PhoE